MSCISDKERGVGALLYDSTKRAMDFIGACVGLAVLSPVLVLLALVVRLTSPGPALFCQERMGRRGRPFVIYKFRTMVSGTGLNVTSSGDPRLTKVGKILRRYKLDELPQLWNVLVGDMSLVGPRPELPRYVAIYPKEWLEVLAIRPGITDFAAIEFVDEERVLGEREDPELAYVQEIMPRKLAMYRSYLQRRSISVDLLIIAKTLCRIVGCHK